MKSSDIRKYLEIIIRLVLGFIFLYASLDKIIYPQKFAEVIYNYRLMPIELLNICAIIVPWVEAFIGVSLLIGSRVDVSAFMLSVITFFFILIKVIRPKTKKHGSTFAIYLIFAGVERFFMEFIRVNPKGFLGLTNYQFSSIALVLAGIILLLFFVKQPKLVK